MPEKRSRTFSLSATVDLPLLGKVGVTEGDSRHACAEASISTFDELKGFNRDRPAVAADQARRGEGGGDHAFTFVPAGFHPLAPRLRSEEHTSELQSLMRISYAVFCLKNKKTNTYDRSTLQ